MNRVLVLVSGYLPGFKSGGPIRTVENMIRALGDEISFRVVCLDRDLGDSHPYEGINFDIWNKQGKADVLYLKSGIFCLPKLVSILRNGDFDVIHLNSCLSFQFSILPLILLRLFQNKTSIIIGPRGEFSKGAFSLKIRKKRLFIFLAKSIGLYDNVIWHASSAYEADDIRRVMGRSVNVRVAIDIADSKSKVTIRKRRADNQLKIVFISRISPKKNLKLAFHILSKINYNIDFDVFGPIEDEDYWMECINASKALPFNIKFSYKGAVLHNEVINKLSEYDLFFFPTLGENFGHVIAEALFAGLPVLISDQTPWRNLQANNLGWDIPLNKEEMFFFAIEYCAKLSGEEYFFWRTNIREWALKSIGNNDAIESNRQLFEVNL